jgi:hypothetical protein
MSNPSPIYGSSDHLIITFKGFRHNLRQLSNPSNDPSNVLLIADECLEDLNSAVGSSHLGLVCVDWYDNEPHLVLQGQPEQKNRLMALHHTSLGLLKSGKMIPPPRQGFVGEFRGTGNSHEVFLTREPYPTGMYRQEATPAIANRTAL